MATSRTSGGATSSGWWHRPHVVKDLDLAPPRWAFGMYVLGIAVLGLVFLIALPALGVKYGELIALPFVVGYHVVVLRWWTRSWPSEEAQSS